MWICSVILQVFLKKIWNLITHQKNYQIIIENVFSQPELFCVIDIKYFSENYRRLCSNFCRWEFCEIIYWIITVKYCHDVWWDPEPVSAFTIHRF